MDSYTAGKLNKVRRGDRASYDRAAIHALLDEAMVAHVGFIDEERPIVIPMIHGRVEDTLYLHGAKAARFAKAMAPGLPICLTVTLLDGIVVGRSAFHMSMNYRSAVIHGRACLVTDATEAEKALAAITDHVLPGRWAESRPMLDKELKATSVLRVAIEAASLKSRDGPPVDEQDDYSLPIWAGAVPLSTQIGRPQDDGRIVPGTPVPPSVTALLARQEEQMRESTACSSEAS
jgi:nitroimidazol reductase NimA-like FMN-containing flavoprotein (pyridoxamine 5'-phosphate oxidase superfamily)